MSQKPNDCIWETLTPCGIIGYKGPFFRAGKNSKDLEAQ